MISVWGSQQKRKNEIERERERKKFDFDFENLKSLFFEVVWTSHCKAENIKKQFWIKISEQENERER